MNLILKNFLFFCNVAIFGLVFIKFHYQFLIYQSHESFYFAPSIELYLSDYYGNLKKLNIFSIIPNRTSDISIISFICNDRIC